VTSNPNIAARLAERAARRPDHPAIIQGRGRRRRVVSFGQMADRVAHASQLLRQRGLGAGDRAVIFVPMSADLYTTLLGVLHAGGVAVFLDAWAGRARLEAAARLAAPRVFIGTWKAQLIRLTSPALRRVPIAVRPGALSPRTAARIEAGLWTGAEDRDEGGDERGPEPGGPGSDPAVRAAVVAADDHALVTFTTGSTGRPKAAARSHAFLWAQHRVLARHLASREDDIDMPTLPIFVLNNLALGVTTVLPDFDPRRPGDIDPAAVLTQMRDEGVTTTSGSPAFYERLVEHAVGRGEKVPVRALFTGGAPVFPPLARALDAVVEGEAHVLYGSTEAEPIASIPAAELARRSGTPGATGICAGRPVPELELRIIQPADGPVTREVLGPGNGAAAGVAGEIAVAGKHVLPGYLDDPEADALVKIRDGDRVWHRTGDGGLLDEEGRLWLLGRVGQRVEREGETWWPLAAEARALSVAGVRHAAYLGTPEGIAVLCLELGDGTRGTRKQGSELRGRDDVEAQAREALAPIPVDEVRMLERIPRDPRHASKTDVAALRKLIESPRGDG
jgi:olefin beta-lactone synthetase